MHAVTKGLNELGAEDVRSLHEAKSGAVLELWVQKKTIMMYDMISDAVQLQPCSELSYDADIISMTKVLN